MVSTIRQSPQDVPPSSVMAGPNINLDVLDRPATYSGEGISVKSLEEDIHQEREVQNTKVDELKVLRERNVEINQAMADLLMCFSGACLSIWGVCGASPGALGTSGG